ncbi:hypothetical protein GCM10011584_29850 [Nocardioides phosphati]|uniref:DUF4149 domain-containing protein n=1 Tax=Nocardioides phosphati TaxID=1867775 RepID=A0ABQ2NEA6_9ACTN|nr:hypothetical protein [Nocardioides phosphati]GGO92743.1 hypothetical protein GCM10011584_29850 [Nocardioides phosphati]
MTAAAAVATAFTWLWLGMVLAISFLEAPLKFRAPGVDLRTGLAIGRLVFRALNAVEVVALAGVVAALVAASPAPRGTPFAAAAVGLALAAQLLAVRPALTRRSDAVLAGHEGPRSHAHLWYVALELAKVLGLATLGVLLLRA